MAIHLGKTFTKLRDEQKISIEEFAQKLGITVQEAEDFEMLAEMKVDSPLLNKALGVFDLSFPEFFIHSIQPEHIKKGKEETYDAMKPALLGLMKSFAQLVEKGKE